jgi:undecaprenyl diphosphate synthase
MQTQKNINIASLLSDARTEIKHLACVMDGNRRWAKRRGWLPLFGHRQGIKTLGKVVEFCLEKKIQYLSLYTLSLENLKRTQEELSYLFNLMAQEADSLLQKCIDQQIRVRFVGDRSKFPTDLKPICERIEKATEHFSHLYLNLLFCYGSRQEIVSGIKKVIQDIKAGKISEDDLNDTMFSDYLWTNGLPEPDLVIRTGQVVRTSNFMLYQAAYAEYYYPDCLWPELSKSHLEKAVKHFQDVKRNFGT